MSAYFFDNIDFPNHLAGPLDDERIPASVLGRAMVCKKLEMLPFECVARGYLTGSGLKEYNETGTVCGVELPEGLTEASRLPEPIFTPATKAEVGITMKTLALMWWSKPLERIGRRSFATPPWPFTL